MDYTTKKYPESHSGEEVPCYGQLQPPTEQRKKDRFLGVCIIIAAMIIGGTWIYATQLKKINPEIARDETSAKLKREVLPESGFALPIIWSDLGKQLADNGVIDLEKFEAQVEGLDDTAQRLTSGADNDPITITEENSRVLLNLFWALGLGNKSEILETGEMTDMRYGGQADGFASTAGWTLAVGYPMDHYSRHFMVVLTPEQQSLVDEISKNIYRPCCGNSTHFPDCNHGMAMLGLLQLMASQGVTEKEMYKAALAVNSYWFPDDYLAIAQYLKAKGMAWKDVSPKGILAAEYSSAPGLQEIKSQITPIESKRNNGCNV